MAQIKKKKPVNTAEASSTLSPSEKKNAKSLKPVRKIVKKLPKQNSVTTKEAQDTTKVQSKKEDEKVMMQEEGKEKSHKEINYEKKLEEKLGDENKSTLDGNGEKTSDNQENNEKQTNLQVRDKEKNVTNEKHDEKSHRDQKGKENLGGLILMCNERTKPDCFHYGVMGVPLNMKELVMGIKPGLNLFLYDVDHKLMYGIYKASSSGGMKLERSAFNGAFPVQVRFKVHKDCLPLPESVFKKAIKENYIEKKNKFKTQLTIQQVKKLTKLFQSNVQYLVPAPPPAMILQPPTMPTLAAHEYFDHQREPPFWAHKEADSRNSYYDESRRNYLIPNHETEQLLRPTAPLHGNTSSKPKEAAPLDHLFLTEKEYRAYGLRQAPRNSTPKAPSAPTLDASSRDPHHSYPSVTAYSDPHALHQRKEPTAEPYHLVPMRETYLPNPSYPDRVTYDPSRRGIYEAEGLYSSYSSNTLSESSHRHYMGSRAELAPATDSSWYSYAGPSFSFR